MNVSFLCLFILVIVTKAFFSFSFQFMFDWHVPVILSRFLLILFRVLPLPKYARQDEQ